MSRSLFGTLVLVLHCSFALAAAPMEFCVPALAPQPREGQELKQRHLRLVFGRPEVDIFIGGDSRQNSLENSYLVIGSSRRTEGPSTAKKVEALPRYDFKRVEFSNGMKTITLYGANEADVTATIRLHTAYNENEPLDVKEISINGLKKVPGFLREEFAKPVAVIDGEANIKIYNGAAAQEILELVKAFVPLDEKSPYYRGMHFFMDQGLYAPFYLQTYVETKHLLRGLRALGLRADHPIFRSLN